MTMYGTFPRTHRVALRPFIKGRRVVDLGCGDCTRASVLLGMGPGALVGIDKDPPCKSEILTHAGYFHEVLKYTHEFKPDLIYLAWPANYFLVGLLDLLQVVPLVAYVGCNTNGTACGGPYLFQYLLGREVLLYVPDRQNTLTLYGGPVGGPRQPTPEESSGLDDLHVHPYNPSLYDSGRQGGVLPG